MADIELTTLTNGLTLVTERDDAHAACALRWALPTGVVRDPDAMIGLSAVVEELLMRGSETLDSRDQSDAFDVLGASRGSETTTFAHELSVTCPEPDHR